MIAEWPARDQAKRLRQWTIIVHVSERVGALPEFDGLMLLGSFAAGRADEVSDVDLVAVVADGRFDDAWARRKELEPPGALFAWDVIATPEAEGGAHKWITRDVVKVECAIVDAVRGDMQLAEPYAVIVGDPKMRYGDLRDAIRRATRR